MLKFQNNYLDKDEPWSGILAAISFTLRSTCHTMLQATPVQRTFGRDMALHTPFFADWEAIRRRKKQLIENNSQNVNKNSKMHIYKVRERVLVRDKKRTNTRIRKKFLTK